MWVRQVAERLLAHCGEPAAQALVGLLEGEWRQLKALRRRFAGDTPGRSILKRRYLAALPQLGPAVPELKACSC